MFAVRKLPVNIRATTVVAVIMEVSGQRRIDEVAISDRNPKDRIRGL